MEGIPVFSSRIKSFLSFNLKSQEIWDQIEITTVIKIQGQIGNSSYTRM